MNGTRFVKLVHEGNYVAEVELLHSEIPEGWEPYLSVEDALKLDNVRKALKAADLKAASLLSKVYSLTPVVV